MTADPARVELDDPARINEIRSIICGKVFLRKYYEELYRKFAACLRRCPGEGLAIELGSGGGFLKEVIPDVVTSDFLPYPGVDRPEVDATRMPFGAESLRAILMLNVFHHIPDVGAFLGEAERCLVPGGRLFMIDQHSGWLGRFVYRYAHHEPFDPDAKDWRFATTGPLSGANGALAWIVFQRDLEKFEKRYPRLKLESYRPHSPLRYWLAGGLKKWTLTPGGLFSPLSWLDRVLCGLSKGSGTFVDVEIVKKY